MWCLSKTRTRQEVIFGSATSSFTMEFTFQREHKVSLCDTKSKFSILSISCATITARHVFCFLLCQAKRADDEEERREGCESAVLVPWDWQVPGWGHLRAELWLENVRYPRYCLRQRYSGTPSCIIIYPSHKCVSVFTLLSKQWSTKLLVFMTKDG